MLKAYNSFFSFDFGFSFFAYSLQFGGKYFAHDVRVIRLPRHGASCPVAIGVSCSADRQATAKITEEGVFLGKTEHVLSLFFLIPFARPFFYSFPRRNRGIRADSIQVSTRRKRRRFKQTSIFNECNEVTYLFFRARLAFLRSQRGSVCPKYSES